MKQSLLAVIAILLACDIILRGGGNVQPLSDDAVKQLMSQESHRKGV